jgi:hypothetical protein
VTQQTQHGSEAGNAGEQVPDPLRIADQREFRQALKDLRERKGFVPGPEGPDSTVIRASPARLPSTGCQSERRKVSLPSESLSMRSDGRLPGLGRRRRHGVRAPSRPGPATAAERGTAGNKRC